MTIVSQITQGDRQLATLILDQDQWECGCENCHDKLALIIARHRINSGAGAEETYAQWQQSRGMLADKVDWAISEYNEFMKDDAYDAQRVLDRIIDGLRTTSAALTTDRINSAKPTDAEVEPNLDEIGPIGMGFEPRHIAALLGEIARISNDYDLREAIEGHPQAIGDSFIWRDCMDHAEKVAAKLAATGA